MKKVIFTVFSHCKLRSSPPFVRCLRRQPRSKKKTIPDDQKDDRYYEKRKRNNQAAKKSRDARKIREDQVGKNNIE